MSENRTTGEVVFKVEPTPEGGFTTRAEDVLIFTDGGTLDALRTNIPNAVACHYGDGRHPPVIQLRIVIEGVLRLDW